MLPRWLRLFVALATALAAWVVATPARAAAGFCDQRGATMVAPAPLLLLPQTSIDAAPASDDDCLGRLAEARSVEGGRTPSPPRASVSIDLAVTAAVHGVVDAIDVPSRDVRDARSGEREGVHARVDRPPRG